MRPYIADLLTGIRGQVLLAVIAPYSRVTLTRLGAELGTSAAEAEVLCVAAILDGKLGGTLDGVAGTLTLMAPGQTARSATAAEAAAASGTAHATPAELVGMGGKASAVSRARAVNKYTEIERLAHALRAAVTNCTTVEIAPRN